MQTIIYDNGASHGWLCQGVYLSVTASTSMPGLSLSLSTYYTLNDVAVSTTMGPAYVPTSTAQASPTSAAASAVVQQSSKQVETTPVAQQPATSAAVETQASAAASSQNSVQLKTATSPTSTQGSNDSQDSESSSSTGTQSTNTRPSSASNASPSSSAAGSGSGSNQSSDGLSTGAEIGSIIGSVCAVLAIIVTIYFSRKKLQAIKRESQHQSQIKPPSMVNPYTVQNVFYNNGVHGGHYQVPYHPYQPGGMVQQHHNAGEQYQNQNPYRPNLMGGAGDNRFEMDGRR